MTGDSGITRLSSFGIELVGRGRRRAASVRGVMRVTEVGGETVAVQTYGGRVLIKGEGLRLCILEERSLEVVGAIYSVELSGGRG